MLNEFMSAELDLPTSHRFMVLASILFALFNQRYAIAVLLLVYALVFFYRPSVMIERLRAAHHELLRNHWILTCAFGNLRHPPTTEEEERQADLLRSVKVIDDNVQPFLESARLYRESPLEEILAAVKLRSLKLAWYIYDAKEATEDIKYLIRDFQDRTGSQQVAPDTIA